MDRENTDFLCSNSFTNRLSGTDRTVQEFRLLCMTEGSKVWDMAWAAGPGKANTNVDTGVKER